MSELIGSPPIQEGTVIVRPLWGGVCTTRINGLPVKTLQVTLRVSGGRLEGVGELSPGPYAAQACRASDGAVVASCQFDVLPAAVTVDLGAAFAGAPLVPDPPKPPGPPVPPSPPAPEGRRVVDNHDGTYNIHDVVDNHDGTFTVDGVEVAGNVTIVRGRD